MNLWGERIIVSTRSLRVLMILDSRAISRRQVQAGCKKEPEARAGKVFFLYRIRS